MADIIDMADIIKMAKLSNKSGETGKSSSHDSAIVEELELDFHNELAEARANFQYVCERCEDALASPEDMRKLLPALHSINRNCTAFWRIAEDAEDYGWF
jgi:hypothetical protein